MEPAARQWLHRVGVRTFLFLILSLVAAVPVALLGAIQVQRWRGAEIEAAQRTNLASAESLARQLSLRLLGYTRAADSLSAQVQALESPDAERMCQLLQAHHRREPEFFGWYVADARGISICNTIHDREVARGVDYSDRDYFRRAKETESTVVSKVQHGRLSGVPNVQIASPMLNASGDFIGIVEGSVNLDPLLEETRRAAQGIVDGRVVVLDAQHRVLADSTSPVVTLRSVADVSVFRGNGIDPVDENGELVYAATVPVTESGVAWRVVAMRSRASVERQANVAVRDTLVVALAALLAALVVAAFVAQWLASPLRRLSSWAKVWGGRTPSGPGVAFHPRDYHGPREFKDVAIAIGDMIDRIQSQTQHLEAEVASRTRELVHTNAELQVLATATQNAGESIEVTDPDMRFVFVNPAFERLTGYTGAEVIGRTPAEVLRSGQYPPEFYEEMAAKALSGVFRGSFSSRRKDGSLFEQEIAVTVVRDERGEVRQWVALRRDVSELQRTRELLRLNDRMVSVGTLAAGIAHEINNPLTYVTSNVSYSLDACERSVASGRPVGGEVQSALREALDGSRRVASIVGELRTFAKPDDTPLGPVDVAAVLESSLRMVGNELRHRSELVADIPPGTHAFGNAAKLGQVFINVLVNALQAMDESKPHGNVIRVRARSDDEIVVIELSDNGRGMPPDVLAQAFDPFFTTKSVGHGMGLGLTICHNIVRGMDGTIRAKSEAGRGTTIRIELPRGRGVTHVRRDSAPHSLSVRASILIVDDDEPVARALARVLDDHDVHVATGGQDGLERMQVHDYDVVLCDLMMPQFTGMDLYQALVESHCERLPRIVFMTGGTFTERAREFVQREGVTVLQKPLSVRELKDAIANVLVRVALPKDESD